MTEVPVACPATQSGIQKLRTRPRSCRGNRSRAATLQAFKDVAFVRNLEMPRSTGGIPKENALTARLLGILRNRGFTDADFEQHFPVFQGRDRKPDGAFSYHGTHLISAKWGKGKEGEAVASAQEHQMLIGEPTQLG